MQEGGDATLAHDMNKETPVEGTKQDELLVLAGDFEIFA